jgi:sec-independent protein translocase protein TatB
MDILGIGAPELIFILIIALIVLGPKDMQRAGRTVGRWLNQLVRSDGWKVFQRTSAEIRNLPTNLMREANMEMAEIDKEVRNAIDPRTESTSPSGPQRPSAEPRANRPRYTPAENPSPTERPLPNTGAKDAGADEPGEPQ